MLNQRLEALRLGLASKIPVPIDRPGAAAELLRKDLNGVLWAWMNWAYRSIPSRPRQVFFASTFDCGAIPQQWRERVEAIVAMIQRGDDLTPYLSAKISTHGYVGHRTSKGKPASNPQWADNAGDKDLALNAYGLHHLHLGNLQKGATRCAPTDELLFIEFRRDAAALVFFGKHSSFNDGLLPKAATAWRREQRIHFKDDSRWLRASDENRLKGMERRGFSTVRETHGFFVPIFQSITGHSYEVSTHADDCHDAIDLVEERLTTDNGIRSVFSDLGVPPPSDPTNIVWGMQHCDLTLGNNEIDSGRIILPGPH